MKRFDPEKTVPVPLAEILENYLTLEPVSLFTSTRNHEDPSKIRFISTDTAVFAFMQELHAPMKVFAAYDGTPIAVSFFVTRDGSGSNETWQEAVEWFSHRLEFWMRQRRLEDYARNHL